MIARARAACARRSRRAARRSRRHPLPQPHRILRDHVRLRQARRDTCAAELAFAAAELSPILDDCTPKRCWFWRRRCRDRAALGPSTQMRHLAFDGPNAYEALARAAPLRTETRWNGDDTWFGRSPIRPARPASRRRSSKLIKCRLVNAFHVSQAFGVRAGDTHAQLPAALPHRRHSARHAAHADRRRHGDCDAGVR
jgi:hypothetical protein